MSTPPKKQRSDPDVFKTEKTFRGSDPHVSGPVEALRKLRWDTPSSQKEG